MRLLAIAALLAAAASGCRPCGNGPDELLCTGLCVDSMTDDANCGACGVVCPDGAKCKQGSCQTTCTTGLTACGPACVDLSSDGANCGSCGNQCAVGAQCGAGKCHVPCPMAQV